MTSTRLRAAAALSVLALLAGCGGDDGGDDGGSEGGSGDSGSSASDFAEQDGQAIADAAKADMRELEAVRYTGDISSGADTISLDVQASSTGSCTGSVTIGEGTAEVLTTADGSWFRPDEAFWRAQAPDQADAVIAAVGDKWVVDADQQFAQFCDLDEFFANVFADEDDEATYETVGTEELDGQEVVKVENTDSTGSSTGYVVVDSPHYLLKVERTTGDEPGVAEFGSFDEESELEAPAADQVVDLSQL